VVLQELDTGVLIVVLTLHTGSCGAQLRVLGAVREVLDSEGRIMLPQHRQDDLFSSEGEIHISELCSLLLLSAQGRKEDVEFNQLPVCEVTDLNMRDLMDWLSALTVITTSIFN
jgi:hypothetical protein